MTNKTHQFKVKLQNDPDSSLLWNYRIIVPSDISSDLIGKDRRILCAINDHTPIHAALMPDGMGNYFVMVNKELRKKLKVDEGDELSISIEKDLSKYGMFVPDAFTEINEQDPEGSALFHQLTMGKQRTLLHLMGKPKSETKQIEKTLIIFDYLKSVNGNLDFKALNEAFKNSRFRQ